MRTKPLLLICSLIVVGHLPDFALAQDLPTRPVTIVSPYAGGGSTDFALRSIGRKVDETGKLTVVIESRAGGAGAVAAGSVKTANPDGTTLMLADVGTFASNISLLPNLSYDPVKDFRPITLLWSLPNFLAVPADSPANSLQELVDLSRKKPGGLSYASQAVGASGHLLGSMLAKSTGAPMTHVAYRGAGPATTDLIAGRVDFFFTSYATVRGFVEAKQIKLLAVTSKDRDTVLPSVPTVAEAGYPQLQMDIWFGLAAPAATPENVIMALSEVFSKAATGPDIVEKLREQGMQPVHNSPSDFKRLIENEIARYRTIIADIK